MSLFRGLKAEVLLRNKQTHPQKLQNICTRMIFHFSLPSSLRKKNIIKKDSAFYFIKNQYFSIQALKLYCGLKGSGDEAT